MTRQSSVVSRHGLFVTGTDTGVGKTLVACALLHALGRAGLRVVGMKPVAAGARRRLGTWINEDVEQLRRAGNVAAPRHWINPYCLGPAIAPHIAAREAGVTLRLDRIESHYHKLAELADVVVVEGAGGLLVPLSRAATMADIPLKLRLPVVLVVGMRLGCLNHALLTVDALQRRGLRLAGWVANQVAPDMPRRRANLEALRARIPAPLLASFGHQAEPHPQRIARHLDARRCIDAISEWKQGGGLA